MSVIKDWVAKFISSNASDEGTLSKLVSHEVNDSKRLWVDGDTSVLGERAVAIGNAVKAALANVGKFISPPISDEGALSKLVNREVGDSKRLWIDGDTSVLGERAVLIGNAVKTTLKNIVTGGHATDGVSGNVLPTVQGSDQRHH
jgi:phage-related protein